MLRHSLTAFLLRLAHLATSSTEAGRRTESAFTLFRDAVERDFATQHSVSAYADALGYSRRTLVRAVPHTVACRLWGLIPSTVCGETPLP